MSPHVPTTLLGSEHAQLELFACQMCEITFIGFA
jgi:hypothetical protein